MASMAFCAHGKHGVVLATCPSDVYFMCSNLVPHPVLVQGSGYPAPGTGCAAASTMSCWPRSLWRRQFPPQQPLRMRYWGQTSGGCCRMVTNLSVASSVAPGGVECISCWQTVLRLLTPSRAFAFFNWQAGLRRPCGGIFFHYFICELVGRTTAVTQPSKMTLELCRHTRRADSCHAAAAHGKVRVPLNNRTRADSVTLADAHSPLDCGGSRACCQCRRQPCPCSWAASPRDFNALRGVQEAGGEVTDGALAEPAAADVLNAPALRVSPPCRFTQHDSACACLYL